MSVIPFVSQPFTVTPYATPSGELVATTPLGRDADGKNLTAYIVRSDEPLAPLPQKLFQTANNNTPDLKKQPRVKTEAPARFVKPDHLLNALEQAHVHQLRAREGQISDDASHLHDGAGNALLTSFVYDRGPDGRHYAVGVAAPLLAQKAASQTHPHGLKGGIHNPYIQASLAYRHTSSNDSQGYQANIVDLRF